MNLHSYISPYIAAGNPQILVVVRVSTGPATIAPDGSQTPSYATPGAFTGAITGTELTVSAITKGQIQVGQAIAGAGVPDGTTIAELDSGQGGVGTYVLNQAPAAPIAAEPMTSSYMVLGQLQALSSRDLRQIEGLNLQGTLRALYLTGDLEGVVRPTLKGGDLIILPDASVWLVTLVPEPWNLTAGWTKAIVVLQNGS